MPIHSGFAYCSFTVSEKVEDEALRNEVRRSRQEAEALLHSSTLRQIPVQGACQKTLEAENTRVCPVGLPTFRKLLPAVRKPDTVSLVAKKCRP